MNRKPIFDAVRAMLGRGFTQAEVVALDLACGLAEAATPPPDEKPSRAVAGPPAASQPVGRIARLGSLSEKYESSGRGPGTVSSGSGDSGGVSYGVYQLSSSAGTLSGFLKAEGKPWAASFGQNKGGSAAFSENWKAIAKADPGAFGDAQHSYIDRTHYRPAIDAVRAAKGIDLDSRHDAVREASWSISVQHGRAAMILIAAIDACDREEERTALAYDRALVEAMYKARTDYVLGVANGPKLLAAERKQLIGITQKRYPSELADALKLFAGAAPPAPAPAPVVNGGGSVDGNVIAANNGVVVKSAAVKISRLHPKMELAIVNVARVAKTLGLPQPVITSGNDSKHMDGSLHYEWRALDFRGNNIQPNVGKKFAAEVATALGSEYDVAFETFLNATNNHLHVEYDPK